MALSANDEVRSAANEVVAAFSRHDKDAYFASFSPTATFLFHNHPAVLESRAQYEQLWNSWEEAGFRVLRCTSHDGAVHLLDENLGIFTHSVRTTVTFGNEPVVTRERETIVFQRLNGQWLGVHEHLSIDPTT